jgi:transposase-like protein
MAISCPYCSSRSRSSEPRNSIVCIGSFRRASDQSKQQRFRCKPCKKSFSTATLHPCYRQRRREINPRLFEYLASGLTQRRSARILSVNRKTIVRRAIFLGLFAYQQFLEHRSNYPVPVSEFQFDDLETFEHSKMKPLSVTMAVESGSRRILGFRVSRMPAKGLLAQRSRKKYGFRPDERKRNRRALLEELKPLAFENVLIKSDQNPHYLPDIKRIFKKATHTTFKGRKGCVVGQGELKAGGFDPIFSLNHTFAMLRANIHRLFRRTWNTTKKPERLALQIAIYSLYHNLVLID